MKLRPSYVCLCCLVAAVTGLTGAVRGATEPVYDVSLSNRFQYVKDATRRDSDMRTYGSASAYNLMDGHLDAHFSGASDLDLNGQDVFDRAYNESWPRVHEAYLDLHDYGALSHLVLGRQYLPQVDYLHYDGLTLSLWEQKTVGAFAFGGRPVSYYTSNDNEWLGGGGVRYRPLASTTVQADGYGIHENGDDHVANALRIWQHYACGAGDSIEARWLDGEFRDLSTRLFYQAPRYDVSGLIYWQASRWGEDEDTRESRDFALYSAIMNPSEENLYLSLDGNRYVGNHVTLNAGAAYKYILDRDREGGANYTNIDSQRFTGGISVTDWPLTGLSLDLSGSYYLHPDENFYEITAEVGYAFTPKFHASGGMTWGQYDFYDWLPFRDRFNNPVPDERGGTETSNLLFVEARYRLSADWRVALRAEDEILADAAEDAYSISVRVDYHFRTSPGK